MKNQETIFEKLTHKRNISVEEMKAIIADRIKKGWNDPEPEKQTQWHQIPGIGKIPTPEEWLRYAVNRLREDLLHPHMLE